MVVETLYTYSSGSPSNSGLFRDLVVASDYSALVFSINKECSIFYVVLCKSLSYIPRKKQWSKTNNSDTKSSAVGSLPTCSPSCPSLPAATYPFCTSFYFARVTVPCPMGRYSKPNTCQMELSEMKYQSGG